MRPGIQYALEVKAERGTLATNGVTVLTFQNWDDAGRFSGDAKKADRHNDFLPVKVAVVAYPSMFYRSAGPLDTEKHNDGTSSPILYVIGD